MRMKGTAMIYPGNKRYLTWDYYCLLYTSKLKGKGKLTEKEVNEAMREVKLALLEADVNFKVVKEFIAKVSEKAVGEEVLKSLTPGQQIIKIVDDELTELMGGTGEKLEFSKIPPTVIMMAGLQGAGKTTACAKLALVLKKQNAKRPLLVACDVYRPAAVKQLCVVGGQVDVPVFFLEGERDVVKIASEALEPVSYTHLLQMKCESQCVT